MTQLKIIFAGTPEFAAASLGALLGRPELSVIAVYTQPDKPAGRGQQLRESAVKQLAMTQGLAVYQPASLRDETAISNLRALGADLLVVAAYGQILPRAVLEAPRLGAINVHASLLPRWRGAAPIQRALMAGDRETGITIMHMVERLDAGPILLARATPIRPDDTGGSLHDRLAALGASCLLESLGPFAAGTPPPAVEQEEALVTYARKLERSDRELDWQRPASELARQIRALSPVPLATASLGAIQANILSATSGPALPDAMPGELALDGDRLRVATGAGALEILSLQPAGKKLMQAREFINGYRSRLQPAG